MRSADERRRKWLAAGKARIDFVPELDGRLAQLPAEQHRPPIQLARKIDQPDAAVLQLNVERFELRLKGVELLGDFLDAALESPSPTATRAKPSA